MVDTQRVVVIWPINLFYPLSTAVKEKNYILPRIIIHNVQRNHSFNI